MENVLYMHYQNIRETRGMSRKEEEELEGVEGRGEEIEEEEERLEEEVVEEAEKPRMVRCRVCGEKIRLQDYMTHLKQSHPEEYEAQRAKVAEGLKKTWVGRREKIREVAEKARKVEEMPPEQLVALFGREGLDELKLRRLIDMLDIAPNVTSSQKRWIEQRWKTYERMRSDPQELFRVLKDEAGVKDKIASAIVQAVFSLESEYADVLARRGEPVFAPTMRSEPGVEMYQWEKPRPYGRPSWPEPNPQQYPWQPYQTYSPYGYQPTYPPPYSYRGREREDVVTREELRDILDKWFSERFEKRKIEETLDMLRNALEGVKDYIEETRHEFDKKILTLRETGKTEPSPEIQLLAAKLEEANKRVDELSSQLSGLVGSIEKKEKERIEAEIRLLREQNRELMRRFEEMSRPTGGYESDTYRLLGDLLREARHRKPLETLGRILFPERFPPHYEKLPSSSPIPPSMESELKAAGLLEESYGG
jgi:hypothetical protein